MWKLSLTVLGLTALLGVRAMEAPPVNCKVWYDGCNTCTVSKDGQVQECTEMACEVQDTPECRAYFSKPEGPSIPQSCTRWYDGCNSCTVKNGVIQFCTEMYCAEKSKPFCADFVSTAIVNKVVHVIGRVFGGYDPDADSMSGDSESLGVGSADIDSGASDDSSTDSMVGSIEFGLFEGSMESWDSDDSSNIGISDGPPVDWFGGSEDVYGSSSPGQHGGSAPESYIADGDAMAWFGGSEHKFGGSASGRPVALGPEPGCFKWYDGCNTCEVSPDGSVLGCTTRWCDRPGRAHCLVHRPRSVAPIPLDCTSWFDGCNVCIVEHGHRVACTEAFCPADAQSLPPRCLHHRSSLDTIMEGFAISPSIVAVLVGCVVVALALVFCCCLCSRDSTDDQKAVVPGVVLVSAYEPCKEVPVDGVVV
uniref:Uncharacterized protein n=1 Tax=Eutreptiella gymnastica TaxID=73025 RepID=A0A7S4GA42_9EUGL|mmetsp:Transcript_55843/g.92795  ORF Transcript_55843/g.92795 Transcript_55843/m.92795 type:complete len:420 (+) Transcript_55843:30-1289(+)